MEGYKVPVWGEILKQGYNDWWLFLLLKVLMRMLVLK
jgi:hypothetical protein